MTRPSPRRTTLWGAVFVAAATTPALAEISLPPLFSNGFVLQQNAEVKVWGQAAARQTVTVSLRGHKAGAVADAHGKWQVTLPSGAPGGPFPMQLESLNSKLEREVYVGEVWVCSGQSNMWWPVATRPGSPETKGTENPFVRLFNVSAALCEQPAESVGGEWKACGPESLVNFSAVAYHFGREIQATQRVPVGLIAASYGGSGVGQWTGQEALETDPELQAIREREAQENAERAQKLERLKPEIERYQAALAKAKLEGLPLPVAPRGFGETAPGGSRLYNGMIRPLQPYGIRGVLWYQGEANTNRPDEYKARFSALIRGWRKDWAQGAFPFLFVQLAPYQKMVSTPQESQWAALREAQLQTLESVENTGMAVITDWGHETDIHVKQKQPVGERLALLARKRVYGEPVVASGPLFKKLEVRDGKAIVHFSEVGTGLWVRRMVLESVITDTRNGTGGALHAAKDEDQSAAPPALAGFTIAGADRIFHNATAELEGGTVVVSSALVPAPVAVRYGWADYPTGNLFNKEGLPACPFRSDDWTRESLNPRVR